MTQRSEQERIILNKYEVARRELEAAINMLFQEGDPVAIHVLASAAMEIVNTLSIAAGVPSSLLETGINSQKPELRRLIRKAARTPQNFFKHADKDPDEVLLFDPELNEFLVFDGVETYIRLVTGGKSGMETVPSSFWSFKTYFYLKFLAGNPEVDLREVGLYVLFGKMFDLNPNDKRDFIKFTQLIDDWRKGTFPEPQSQIKNWRQLYED